MITSFHHLYTNHIQHSSVKSLKQSLDSDFSILLKSLSIMSCCLFKDQKQLKAVKIQKAAIFTEDITDDERNSKKLITSFKLQTRMS